MDVTARLLGASGPARHLTLRCRKVRVPWSLFLGTLNFLLLQYLHLSGFIVVVGLLWVMLNPPIEYNREIGDAVQDLTAAYEIDKTLHLPGAEFELVGVAYEIREHYVAQLRARGEQVFFYDGKKVAEEGCPCRSYIGNKELAFLDRYGNSQLAADNCNASLALYVRV